MQDPKAFEKLAPKLICFLRKGHLPLQMRLDLLDVFCLLRPAARVLVRPDDEANEVCQNILSAGYSIAVGKGMKWQPKSSVVSCHDWFSENFNKKTLEAMAVLYVASSQDEADQTRAADETRDDAFFARRLGYPSCCIEWVSERKAVPALSECIELYANNGSYDPLLWPGAMLYDAPLTAHYPCSKDCMHSRLLARSRIELLSALGCYEILEKIIHAREKVYFLDAEQKLRAVPIANFIENGQEQIARPSIAAADYLNIVR